MWRGRLLVAFPSGSTTSPPIPTINTWVEWRGPAWRGAAWRGVARRGLARQTLRLIHSLPHFRYTASSSLEIDYLCLWHLGWKRQSVDRKYLRLQ